MHPGATLVGEFNGKKFEYELCCYRVSARILYVFARVHHTKVCIFRKTFHRISGCSAYDASSRVVKYLPKSAAGDGLPTIDANSISHNGGADKVNVLVYTFMLCTTGLCWFNGSSSIH